MSNRYRVLRPPPSWPGGLPFKVQTLDGAYGPGEEFDHEFSEDDETENLKSGLLQIVPRSYRVIGESVVDDTEPGDIFDAAMTVGREALLVAGGHIERVEPVKKPSKPKSA